MFRWGQGLRSWLHGYGYGYGYDHGTYSVNNRCVAFTGPLQVWWSRGYGTVRSKSWDAWVLYLRTAEGYFYSTVAPFFFSSIQ